MTVSRHQQTARIAAPQPPQAKNAAGGPQAQFEEDFGNFLVTENIVDRLVLERAASAARTTGERLDQVLTKLGLVAEVNLATALAKFLSLDLVKPADVPLEPLLIDFIEPDFIRRNRVLPLARDGDTIAVGVTDPLNEEPVRALAYLTGFKVKVRIFTAADFEKAFDTLYSVRGSDQANSATGSGEAAEFDIQRLRDIASEAPVIRLVNQIIAGAVETRASDIHIEPNVDQVLVRYRIDGTLRNAQVLASSLRSAITSRLKIMAKLDIAERRLPQDGRIKIAVRGVDIDFRVSTIPTIFGESVVLRVLDRSRVTLDFEALGFSSDQIGAFQKLLDEPNGIILVTGPTGSGKTTTLYTALKSLNSRERKIFSVEDPIEYQLTGINQVQVQAEIGLDFPHALRAILRQDPDIIMIGEIRDLPTARIAIQSSLTGHLVLSTLHTNSAAAAITRMIDIGVENYLLASTVKGVIAQRLVRTLCRHCAQNHKQADHWARELKRTVPGIERFGEPKIREPLGCSECSGVGYLGRSTIAEVLLADSEVQSLLLAKASDNQLEKAARGQGMRSMYETGAFRVWQGETTMDEVLRATRMG
jgi:general secretion pathway protein E